MFPQYGVILKHAPSAVLVVGITVVILALAFTIAVIAAAVVEILLVAETVVITEVLAKTDLPIALP